MNWGFEPGPRDELERSGSLRRRTSSVGCHCHRVGSHALEAKGNPCPDLRPVPFRYASYDLAELGEETVA